MFGWFRQKKVRPARPGPRPQLRVEMLEDRCCPSVVQSPEPPPPPPENQAPVITSVTATRIGEHLCIEGWVQDETPGSVLVDLIWQSNGWGYTLVTADSSGYFYHVTSWSPEYTTVIVEATDSSFLPAQTVTVDISTPVDANPFIVMEVEYGQRRQITIRGRVYDEMPQALVVYITGAAEASALVNYDGTFTLTLNANYLGTLSAYTVDEAQQISNAPVFTLKSNPPEIVSFTVIEEADGWYEFNGQIYDESVYGLTVYFGGVPVSLQGQWTTVEGDGGFYLSLRLIPDISDEGTVWAQVWDWWGLASNIVFCLVDQTGVS